ETACRRAHAAPVRPGSATGGPARHRAPTRSRNSHLVVLRYVRRRWLRALIPVTAPDFVISALQAAAHGTPRVGSSASRRSALRGFAARCCGGMLSRQSVFACKALGWGAFA